MIAPRSSGLLLAVAACGALLFLLQLGATGVVDETPALFAASARGMATSGDWLVPHVNGLPRYDKPPLVYWLMGLLYALPGHERWDPLGTWAANLPSALATIGLMLLLADTLRRWPQTPQGNDSSRLITAASAWVPLLAALLYGLSPLTLVWGRVGVSDALFSALLASGLLLAWRTYAAERGPWWPSWLCVALAMLTKGPVALVLQLLTLGLFLGLQRDWRRLLARLRPGRGMILSVLLVAPWFGLVLAREGEPFWQSFFLYHNAQRFSQVVNNHQQPWWYFLVVLLIAALPTTPLLLLALGRGLSRWRSVALAPSHSLARFALAWLLAVLAFFTLAATKLPSYWLPAIPAAALLVALVLESEPERRRPWKRPTPLKIALATTVFLQLTLATAWAAAPLWLARIEEPAMAGWQAPLERGSWWIAGSLVLLASGLVAAWSLRSTPVGSAAAPTTRQLALSQIVLSLIVPLSLLPVNRVLDQFRGEPLRRIAASVQQHSSGPLAESPPVAMVGLMKPSLAFYSRRLVRFEGRSPRVLVNLAERLRLETRQGLPPSTVGQQPFLLLVIDQTTAQRSSWQGLDPQRLDEAAPYQLWRVERRRLERRAAELRDAGFSPNWRQSRPERL